MKEVTIYTDGACRGNPGPGGWGAVLTFGVHQKEISGGCSHTTNNTMELTAVIQALSALNTPCKVTVFSDSQYVVSGAEKWIAGWIRRNWVTTSNTPVMNKELWLELLVLMDNHDVSFRWVRGHNGDKLNELCDELARAAIPAV